MSQVQTLLGAVRRRLWRAQFVAAARWATWGSAGWLLLAVAVHLAARPVSVDAVLVLLALTWACAMAWAGWRRPSDPACALWADRHLGGTSAFTTLLDTGTPAQAATHGQAVQWLRGWAQAQVPQSLRLLAERVDPAHLRRPVLALLVCAALAALVLTSPGLAPPPAQQAQAPLEPQLADRPTPFAKTTKSADLASEVADALRPAQAPEAPEAPDRGTSGKAQSAVPGKADGGKRPQSAPTAGEQAGARATAGNAASGKPGDAPSAAGTGQAAAGTSAGREAGDGRDDRADTGFSRSPRGTISVQRSEPLATRASADRRADMDSAATYVEDLPALGTPPMRPGTVPAAATAPAVTPTMRLTPTETSYVQAWMKASERRR